MKQENVISFLESWYSSKSSLILDLPAYRLVGDGEGSVKSILA